MIEVLAEEKTFRVPLLLKEFRCFKCKKLLLKYENKIKIIIRCPRCKVDNYMNIEKIK